MALRVQTLTTLNKLKNQAFILTKAIASNAKSLATKIPSEETNNAARLEAGTVAHGTTATTNPENKTF